MGTSPRPVPARVAGNRSAARRSATHAQEGSRRGPSASRTAGGEPAAAESRRRGQAREARRSCEATSPRVETLKDAEAGTVAALWPCGLGSEDSQASGRLCWPGERHRAAWDSALLNWNVRPACGLAGILDEAAEPMPTAGDREHEGPRCPGSGLQGLTWPLPLSLGALT